MMYGYFELFSDVEDARRKEEIVDLLRYLKSHGRLSNKMDTLVEVAHVIAYFVNEVGYNKTEVADIVKDWCLDNGINIFSLFDKLG